MDETKYTLGAAWQHTQALVVKVSRQLVDDPADLELLAELRAYLKAEEIARKELEACLREEAQAA